MSLIDSCSVFYLKLQELGYDIKFIVDKTKEREKVVMFIGDYRSFAYVGANNTIGKVKEDLIVEFVDKHNLHQKIELLVANKRTNNAGKYKKAQNLRDKRLGLYSKFENR